MEEQKKDKTSLPQTGSECTRQGREGGRQRYRKKTRQACSAVLTAQVSALSLISTHQCSGRRTVGDC